MKEILAKIAKGATGAIVRKAATVGPHGGEVTRTRAREGVKGAAWIIGFLLVWHLILQPVLARHFPDYEFPVLDFGWLAGLFMGV